MSRTSPESNLSTSRGSAHGASSQTEPSYEEALTSIYTCCTPVTQLSSDPSRIITHTFAEAPGITFAVLKDPAPLRPVGEN
jgi:hypothetical protein